MILMPVGTSIPAERVKTRSTRQVSTKQEVNSGVAS